MPLQCIEPKHCVPGTKSMLNQPNLEIAYALSASSMLASLNIVAALIISEGLWRHPQLHRCSPRGSSRPRRPSPLAHVRSDALVAALALAEGHRHGPRLGHHGDGVLRSASLRR